MALYGRLSLLLLLTILLPSGVFYAQSSEWAFTTRDGTSFTKCKPLTVNDSQLVILHNGITLVIPLEMIAAIGKPSGSQFWTGAGLGFLAGAFVGMFVGLMTYESPKPGEFVLLDFGPGLNAAAGSIIGGISGFIVGGIIGATSRGVDWYDVSSMSSARKALIVKDYLVLSE